MSRQALGRGLSALLGDQKEFPVGNGEYIELDIDLLKPNSEQPRENFSGAEMEELAQSIRVNGVVQPIIARRNGESYQIVAGERRWRAAQIAELKKIPAIVRDISDDKLLEIALIENIQRQELNPVEEARAYKKLIDTFGLTQEMVADQVGKTRPFVANYLRLLRLPKTLIGYLESGKITVGHARALLSIEDPIVMKNLAARILNSSMSVRDTEKAVKKIALGRSSKTDKQTAGSGKDANVTRAETNLRRKYGTHVRIVSPSGSGKGKIEIEYYGETDLGRLYDLLMKK